MGDKVQKAFKLMMLLVVIKKKKRKAIIPAQKLDIIQPKICSEIQVL